jgi:hypothetical protein
VTALLVPEEIERSSDPTQERCWADGERRVGLRVMQCSAQATTRVGLCAAHYQQLSGQAPEQGATR